MGIPVDHNIVYYNYMSITRAMNHVLATSSKLTLLDYYTFLKTLLQETPRIFFDFFFFEGNTDLI